MKNPPINLSGVIDTIIHKNAESGFAIMRLQVDEGQQAPYCDARHRVVILGSIAEQAVGQRVSVAGEIVQNKKYGPQVKVIAVTMLEPQSITEMMLYLTKNVKWVDKVYATKIVNKFGMDTFKVLDEAPDRLLEVKGIGPERLKNIKEAWKDQRSIRELLMFATQVGITSSFVAKIHKTYGAEAIRTIKADPYCLARDIHGVGFKKADEVALGMGIPEVSDLRVRAVCLYLLEEAAGSGGDCFMYRQDVVNEVVEFLDHPEIKADMAEQVVSQAGEAKIVIDDSGRIYAPRYYEAECQAAARLQQIMDFPLPASLSGQNIDEVVTHATTSTGLQLHHDQGSAIGRTLRSKVSVITGGPGTGKGLALDTPIPTPCGWKTMADLRVGDAVFDETGTPCTVSFVSETHSLPCYRVRFDDDSSIVTDNQHRWLTWTRAARKSAARRRRHPLQTRGTDQSHKRVMPDVVTTPQIKDTLRGVDGRLNHSIPLAAPLCMPPVELPIDPYVLGVWLGNGDTAGAAITNGCDWIRGEIERLGYKTSDRKARETEHKFGLFKPGGDSILPALRGLKVLGDKHIPEAYLFASIKDRLALLQGLMDTDGHCCKRQGRCEITFTNERLADGCYQLLCGLGIKVHRDQRPAKIDGVVKGTAYRSSFTTSWPLFRLPRKQEALPYTTRPSTTLRYVEAVEAVETVPTRCIQVDSPSHLFLAGHACVPTHNTTITRAVVAGYEAAEATITLLAPTGRAAKRMSEVIGRGANTIHRKLYQLSKAIKEGSILEAVQLRGVIIIDEASMIDVEMLNWLLKYVHVSAILVFVGDIDQLPSVGPGSVLRDLIASPKIASTRLTHIFRQALESDIIRHAHAINSGIVPPICKISRELVKARGWPQTDCYLVECDDQARMTQIALWVATTMSKALGFDPQADVQVLSPMKRGEAGVIALNARMQAAINPDPTDKITRPDQTIWGVGDWLMQTRNNYDYGIFNGDQGRILSFKRDDAGDVVSLVADFDGNEIEIEHSDFYDLTLAYARTVHKSQGSEYPMVILCLHTAHYTLLQRNLLFTGMTRSRKTVVLIVHPQALSMAVTNNRVSRRNTYLSERITQGSKSDGPN